MFATHTGAGRKFMDQRCIVAVAQLPPSGLRRVLLKASIQMIRSLVMAYPQEMGVPFLDALAPTLNPSTLCLLVEEVSRWQVLTPTQVHSAEREFVKLIQDEKILDKKDLPLRLAV
jgi:hypothetical protein